MNQDVTSSATTKLPVQTTPGSSKKPRRRYQKHGLTKLLRGRSKALTIELDGRCTAMQAMNHYKADLLSSLGGKENLSAQELTLVEMCARDQFILEQIDAYLLQAGLFNRRKKTAYPLTVQRMTIADSLTRRLQAIGLSRRRKPVQSLANLLTAQAPDEAGPEARN